MLLNIHVKNFALIDEVDIDLEAGLNILTGETGAGKSILIDAVSAALGGRCNGDVIGRYSDSAYICLVFSIDNKALSLAINELDISTEYDSIIISRKITPDRSIYKINDETVTASKVKQVTELLVDIHGQHEHQSLLKESTQLCLLDKYSDNTELLALCNEAYYTYIDAKKKLEGFDLSNEELARQVEFLSYEIDEISGAGIKPGELEELEARYKTLKNSDSIARDISEALKYLSDNNENATDLLVKTYRALDSASKYDSDLLNNLKVISDCNDILSDAVRDLKSYSNNIDYDQDSLRLVENRIDEINRLEQKYLKGSSSLDDVLKEKQDKLETYKNYEEEKQRAEEVVIRSYDEYIDVATRLSDKRKACAGNLSANIEVALNGLNFLEVIFDVDFSPVQESPSGIDSVTYLISTNPGEIPKPLADVASGGELSRIMLGFKSVLSEKDEISTLIFDEIDAGISGRTASLVSEKLKIISKNHQVICITHLPQIAAMADSHYVIEKAVFDDKTKTTVSRLDDDGEIEELARLLGGNVVSKTAYDNAKELKQLAKG